MSATCSQAMDGVGTGVSAALTAVDCVATQVTAEAFGRLFAPGGSLGLVLTIVLTLYVAFFAISLLLGRTNLNIRQLTPRMITLGLVLTFATSWVAYQSVVWNLAVGAPDYLATILSGSDGSASMDFAAKLDVVFMAVQQASAGQENIDTFSPAGMMWMGATLLMLGTVGVLVTARIGLALLVALGPVFVVLALFNGTRGLFTGWLKGVVMLALTPLFAVLGGSIMLELAVPVLASLNAVPGQIDQQAAMAFFMIGAVHVALMIMVIKVAATMVAGWQMFGLVPSDKAATGERAAMNAPMSDPRTGGFASTAQAAGAAANRRIETTAIATGAPANDAGQGGSAPVRASSVYLSSASDRAQPAAAATASRTRGIGNRFRPARTGTMETKK